MPVKEFIFRGLKFRELKPFGLEVQGQGNQWFGTDFINRKALEQMTEVPDISLWLDRCVVGNLRFKEGVNDS